jgi:hypothetical protein
MKQDFSQQFNKIKTGIDKLWKLQII